MSITEKTVIQALQQSVIAAVGQSIKPTLPMDFLNVTFTKPDQAPWLETVYIPNPGTDTTWGDERIYRGIYRLLLHWPNDGGGSYDATDLAESIMRAYSKSKRLNGVLNLLNQPRLTVVDDDEKELMLVISLEYSSFSR